MHKGLRTLAVLLGGVLLALTGMGCSSSREADRVRVCEVTHSVFYAPQYVALSQGFFAQEGIEVELTNGQGADAVMAAVLSGHIDIGFAGPEASIYVYNEGRDDHTQVFAQVTRRDGSFLIGRTPQPDFEWQSVRGKTLLPGRKGGVPYMALQYVLRQTGIDPDRDVTLDSSVQFGMMTAAFSGGTGDYVTAFEPTASMLAQQGKGYIVASVGEAAGEIPYTAYFAKKSYIEAHEDLISRFTRAVAKGLQWVKAHKAEEIAQAIQDFFPDTEPKLLARAVESYQSIGAWSDTPVMTADSFERLQTVMAQAGELTEKAPFSAIVNNRFAEKTVQ